jgi:hypothetical protein
MSIRTKHRIVNHFKDILFLDAAGVATTAKASVDKIIIPGSGTLLKSSFKPLSYIKTAAIVGTNGTYTVTIGGAASANGKNSVSFKLDVISDRQEAENSRYRQDLGRDYVFGVSVASGASATVVATAIQAVMTERVSRFGDLPFTFTRSGAVLTIILKKPHLKLGKPSISNGDKEGDADTITAVMAETVAPVLPQGQASQVEESISHLTDKDGLAGSWKADERVAMGTEYDEYQLTMNFEDALTALPQMQGANVGSSGSWNLSLFISKNAETAPKALFESLFDGTEVDSALVVWQ